MAAGLAASNGLPAGVERDRLQLGLAVVQGAAYRAVQGFASPLAEESFLRALELCDRLDDGARRVEVRRGLFSFYYSRGDLDRAEQQGREIVAQARGGERGIRMMGSWMVGCMAFWRGRFEPARQALDQALALYDRDEQIARTLALQIDPAVNTLSHLCWTQWILGEPAAAVATGEQAVRTARELDQPYALAMALFFCSVTHGCCGHFAEAATLQDELGRLTAAHGLAYLGSCAKVLQGQALIAEHRCVEGIAQVREALDEFEAQDAALGVPWSMSILASGYAELGEVGQGLAVVERAFEAMRRHDERHWEAEVWRWQGELLAKRSPLDLAQARASLRRAVEVARAQSAGSLEARAAASLARLAAGEGSR